MKLIVTLLALLFSINIIEAQPSISSVSPALGPVGTLITINGNNFGSTAASNIVYFGAVKAVVTAAAPTTLNVIVPGGATSGFLSILNMSSHLTCISPKLFHVTFNGDQNLSGNSFRPAANYTTNSYAPDWYPYALAAGDVDGDGKTDIVMISHRGAFFGANTLTILRNTSTPGIITNGSFAAPVDFALPPNNPVALAIGDIDNDGKPEIAVEYSASFSLTIFRNTSTPGTITSGSLAAGIDFPIGDGSNCLLLCDFDKDGKSDFVAPNTFSGEGNSVSVVRNTSVPGTISFEAPVRFTTGRNNQSIACGDIDGDGKSDIVSANTSDQSISVLRNISVPGSISPSSFAPRVDVATANGLPSSVAVSDIDSDGKPDIVVGGGTVFKNIASTGSLSRSSFGPETPINLPANNIITCDLNGDGKDDFLGNTDGFNFSALQNLSAIGIINSSSFGALVDLSFNNRLKRAIIADFDADGKPDLAVANGDGGGSYFSQSLAVFRNVMKEMQALPLDLVTFTAQAQGRTGISLNWQTSNEVNTSHFVVQRSTDGVMFVDLAKVKCQGNVSVYNYFDASAPLQNENKVYYRLQINDKDGSYIMSETRAVYLAQAINWRAFPNPVKDRLTVQDAALSEVSLYDLTGKRLIAKTAGSSEVVLDLSGLPKGLYLIRVKDRTGNQTTQTLLRE